jgi:hypothetical protein
MRMKAKTAFIALALFAGQAQAEWELIGGTDNFELYIDISTIRKQSGYTLAWFIRDYSKPQTSSVGHFYSSSKYLEVAKCGEYQRGMKSVIDYSSNMGEGNAVYLSSSKEFHQIEFRDVTPDSVSELMYDAICVLSNN